MRLDGQAAAPQEGAGKTAAQCSKRRYREISDRRMPAGREVLEVFQDAGVCQKAADDLHAASARAIACHSDRGRPGISDEVLKSPKGSTSLLSRARIMRAREDRDEWPADQVERWPIDRLIPYAKNSRTHTEAQIAQLAASMKEWGWTNPVLADDAGGVIAGHDRILATRQLGYAVPVMVAPRRGGRQATARPGAGECGSRDSGAARRHLCARSRRSADS
jgi:hypothetical protein